MVTQKTRLPSWITTVQNEMDIHTCRFFRWRSTNCCHKIFNLTLFFKEEQKQWWSNDIQFNLSWARLFSISSDGPSIIKAVWKEFNNFFFYSIINHKHILTKILQSPVTYVLLRGKLSTIAVSLRLVFYTVEKLG